MGVGDPEKYGKGREFLPVDYGRLAPGCNLSRALPVIIGRFASRGAAAGEPGVPGRPLRPFACWPGRWGGPVPGGGPVPLAWHRVGDDGKAYPPCRCGWPTPTLCHRAPHQGPPPIGDTRFVCRYGLGWPSRTFLPLLWCPAGSSLELGRGGGAPAQVPGLRCSSWGVRAWLSSRRIPLAGAPTSFCQIHHDPFRRPYFRDVEVRPLHAVGLPKVGLSTRLTRGGARFATWVSIASMLCISSTSNNGAQPGHSLARW